MGYGVGPISQYSTCNVQYKFQDQFYDMDDKVQQIKDILWKNRIDHRIYFDSTSGCSRISVRMMPYEIYQEIEDIYQKCYIYNPNNNLRRKTKDEFIEDPHLGLPESCRCMLRMYGSVQDPYRNGFIEKVYGYLFKYFYHQHWIHPWCDDKKGFEAKDKAFMVALKALHDDEILQIPGIGKGTEPLVRQMRDDAISGKLKLNKKSFPYPKNMTRAELNTDKMNRELKRKANKTLRDMANEISAKPYKTMGELEEETYKKYGIDPKTQKPVIKNRKKCKPHSGEE